MRRERVQAPSGFVLRRSARAIMSQNDNVTGEGDASARAEAGLRHGMRPMTLSSRRSGAVAVKGAHGMRINLTSLTLRAGIVTGAGALVFCTPLAANAAYTPGGRPASPTTFNGLLRGVGAASATDAWAVGAQFTVAGTRTLALHWDGTRWKAVPSPSPTATNGSILNGVSAVSTTTVLATSLFGDVAATFCEHGSATLDEGFWPGCIRHMAWPGVVTRLVQSDGPDDVRHPRAEDRSD
jgi:hypothetical protein